MPDRIFTFPSADGITQINCSEWRSVGDARAVLQISHSIAEHSGRYEYFARFMTAHGFYVVAGDHLGHGGSVAGSSMAGYFSDENGWQNVVSDLRTLYEITSLTHRDVPYFMLGHGYGSLILRAFLINNPDIELSGAIMSGTGCFPLYAVEGGIRICDVTAKKNGGFRTYSPKLKDLVFGENNDKLKTVRTEFDWLSRDEGEVDDYIKDPLCGADITVGLYRDIFTGYSYIDRMANMWKMRKDIPVLFVSGSEDPMGNYGKGPAKVRSNFNKVGALDTAMKLYEGGRHDMLHEINKAEVFEDMLGWMKEKSS